jgi:hypothetical protein
MSYLSSTLVSYYPFMPFSLSVQLIEHAPFSLDIHRQARD